MRFQPTASLAALASQRLQREPLGRLTGRPIMENRKALLHRTPGQVTRLTWNKTFVLVISVFLVSNVVTSLLLAWSLYLVPPLTNITHIFYLALPLALATLTLILCVRTRPSGSWISGVLLPVYMVVVFVLYWALVPLLFNPVFYSAVECHSVTRSGLHVQYACTCRLEYVSGRVQVECSLDGFALSPILPVTERGKWQAIP